MKTYHCQFCDREPCVFEQHKENVLADIDAWCTMSLVGLKQPCNSHKRNRCYRMFSQYINGYLGRGVRRELPSCVLTNIRKVFPNESSGKGYTGFKIEDDLDS